MSAAATGRTFRVRSVTVDVDVDIDEDLLEENGYHHEDDCTGSVYDDVPDSETNRRALIDWHDLTHGLTLWANCTHEPCRILTDDFRRTA